MSDFLDFIPKINHKLLIVFKILLIIITFVFSAFYFLSNSVLFKAISILILSFGIIQLLLSLISLVLKNYNKPMIVYDIIHGLIFSIISVVLMILFFKNTVTILKAILFGYVILKIIFRIIFIIRNGKRLFKKDISSVELNKLRKSILTHYLIKNIVCMIVLTICYIFSTFYLPIAERFNLYTNF